MMSTFNDAPIYQQKNKSRKIRLENRNVPTEMSPEQQQAEVSLEEVNNETIRAINVDIQSRPNLLDKEKVHREVYKMSKNELQLMAIPRETVRDCTTTITQSFKPSVGQGQNLREKHMRQSRKNWKALTGGRDFEQTSPHCCAADEQEQKKNGYRIPLPVPASSTEGSPVVMRVNHAGPAIMRKNTAYSTQKGKKNNNPTENRNSIATTNFIFDGLQDQQEFCSP